MDTAYLASELVGSANSNNSFGRASAADFILSIFNREMGVTLHNAKAGSKRDEAMCGLTEEAASLYAGRVLRELIQNACDGAASDAKLRILLRLDLSDSTHGTLFAVDNVIAISNPAMSNKTPGNFIGHKGLGFRSVELFSDDVQVFSKMDPASTSFDGFCFGFASEADERDWLNREGAAKFASIVVGKTHRYQLPVPITMIDFNTEKIAVDGFSTVVRLSPRDAAATKRAEEESRMLVNEKAPVTLFLDRLASLTLERIDTNGERDRKSFSGRGGPCGDLRVAATSPDRRPKRQSRPREPLAR
jgi:hypothetical protein